MWIGKRTLLGRTFESGDRAGSMPRFASRMPT